MNRFLHTLKLKTLLKAVAACLVFASLGSASAQLSGAYTINSGAVTGGTNYSSWTGFADSINLKGVSGAVTVTVVTSDSLAKPVIFNAITGASATNTITIDGNSKKLTFAGNATDRAVLVLNGTDYMTVKSLTVSNSGTATEIRGIWMYNGADYNTISKNTVQFTNLVTGTTSVTAGGAFIVLGASSTSLTAVANHGSFNSIEGNTLTTTNAGSQGPLAAIWLYSSATTSTVGTVGDNTVKDNMVKNFFNFGIYMYNQNNSNCTGNDVTRSATSGNANTTIVAINYNYCKSPTTAWKLNNNRVHDLPGAGTSPSTIFGVYSFYSNVSGAGVGTSEINSNVIEDITGSGQVIPFYANYTGRIMVKSNKIDDISQTNSGSTHYAMYLNYSGSGADFEITGNDIEGMNQTAGATWYGLFVNYAQTSSNLVVEDNSIHDFVNTTTSTFGYIYGMYVNYGSAARTHIQRNKLKNLDRGSYYYAYGIYAYGQRITQINTNLLTEIKGAYGAYGLYAYNFNAGAPMTLNQNTLYLDGTGVSYPYPYNYGLYAYSGSDKTTAHGNIVDFRNTYGAYHITNYSNGTNITDFNWNNYYAVNVSYFYNVFRGTGYNSVADYIASGLTGSKERYGDPSYVNVAGGDFASKLYLNQNVVPTSSVDVKDIKNLAKNMVKSDVGAFESYLDLQVSSTSVLPASICAGSTYTALIDVKNTFLDVAKDIEVKYAVTGGNSQNSVITSSVATNATGSLTFSMPAKFNATGAQTLTIGLTSADDNPANDNVVLSTTVKPAPGGSAYVASTKTTKTIYRNGKPDVTQINTDCFYDLVAPRAYTNAGYSVDWTASTWATKADGITLVTGASLVAPAGSTNLEVKFVTTDATLEDETINVYTKFSDLNNTCDTTIVRSILIYPTITPDFKFPAKICDGDNVLFENKSKVKSGAIEFDWDFGTGVVADNTQAPEPVFQFPAAGSYTVLMKAKTLPYGFEVSKSYPITVNAIPKASFKATNACQGLNLTFASNTTPATAILSWTMGDGNVKGNLTNPTHMYANTGFYTVKLNANLNGCIATVEKTAYQFDKPKAIAALTTGTCDNQLFEFANNSTLKSGSYGSFWDFDDAGSVSTLEDANHMFSAPGTKNVKLKVTTDFGCSDQTTVAVTVKESPKTDFSSTPACSIDPTIFTDLTPVVAGVSTTATTWSFGDGGTSTIQNPTHTWTSLGSKNVKFNITLNNGCSQEITKMLSVGVQPTVNFSASDVCAGTPVVFDNKTTWPSGSISYEWIFADATPNATDSDPTHLYNTTETKTYVVTLKARIAGGCEDEIQKQIVVNEAPKTCDFTFKQTYANNPDGRTMSYTPVGAPGATLTGVEYSWIFGNEGSAKSIAQPINHTWQNMGVGYSVTMRAKVISTGCDCSVTKTINFTNTKGVDALKATVYPNPSTGKFNITLANSAVKNVTINLVSMTGAVVKTINTTGTSIVFDASEIANGVYMLNMISNGEMSTVKVNIQH